jgi:hypothetical protein
VLAPELALGVRTASSSRDERAPQMILRMEREAVSEESSRRARRTAARHRAVSEGWARARHAALDRDLDEALALELATGSLQVGRELDVGPGARDVRADA